jgi:sugar phosphate isomerase/epimerase
MPEMNKPFGFCINTSTIKGQGLSLVEEIELAAEVGYDAIEPWVREVDAYVEQGGSLPELKDRFDDAGIVCENLIGFFEWAVDDKAARAAGLEEARRAFEMAAQIGCRKVAAPPSGVSGAPGLNLMRAAERYARVIEIGREYGVTPVLEFWGAAQSLGHLGEALFVAAQCGRPEACILADVFHMYKGGSPFEGLRLTGPDTLGLVHMNDYPADPPRAEIGDADRVWPGDGVAPLADILRTLYRVGFRGMLSLELFNERYYALDADEALRTGLEKMQAAVAGAMGE